MNNPSKARNQPITRKDYWQLFCNDETLAKQFLHSAIQHETNPIELASLCQFLTFYGEFNASFQTLTRCEPKTLRCEQGRGALLRIKQYRHHHNPWLSLCLPEWKPWFEQVDAIVRSSDCQLKLSLGGGLGDMLETMALAYAHRGLFKDRLTILVPKQATQAIAPLLTAHQAQHKLKWISKSNKPQDNSNDAFPIVQTVFRACLARHNPNATPKPVAKLNQQTTTSPRILLCCWRSKVDPEEKLWAHLRSLGLKTILKLYQRLTPVVSKLNLQIIDLTRYEASEIQALNQTVAFQLTLPGAAIKSFLDTSRFFGPNTMVASIDTSLVHLACWYHQAPIVLAHKYKDGRWLQHFWNDVLILEQQQLHNWDHPIDRLIERIENHLWH